MTNNDILRRLRYALNLPDGLALKLFSLGGKPAHETELAGWLKKEEDKGYLACRDETLAAFLDGLVTLKRGPRPTGSPPPLAERLPTISFSKSSESPWPGKRTTFWRLFRRAV